MDKEDTNNKQKQGDLSIFVRDEHDSLLIDVTLTKLSCSRRILKIDSPNGIQLGYVKKGFVTIMYRRFSAYEICDANHHSIFNFDMKSKNHEYTGEVGKVTDTKNGNKIAVIKQREIDSDMLSFQINYISTSSTLQKILIMVAGIGEILQRLENEQCSVVRCWIIPKMSMVSIVYIIIGMFSIVLYIALLIDVLFLIALFILVNICSKGKEENTDECMHQWGECIGFMGFIPVKIYKSFNDLFNICQ